MPKLLQINVTANWGSTGKIAEVIGTSVIHKGWESYIAYGRYSNPSKSKTIRIGSTLETLLHYAIQRIIDNEGLCSTRATIKLVKEIKEVNPDIVHLHNIHDHYLNYKVLFDYLNKTNIKVVWTFHDCWAFTGHCFHFVTNNCFKWRTECKECPSRGEYPKTTLDCSNRNFLLKRELFLMNKNLTIVSCSNWIADYVKDSFFRKNRIEIIHNGIDINIFKPVSNDKNNTFSIIAVSNVWTKDKGFQDIIQLRKLLPSDIKIKIVGVTAKQLKELPDDIIGIQRTQNVSELVELYNEAHVLINTTYADTFPTVNLEALACGTPVITYNTGGSPEAIDEQTGFVVPQGDVAALAKAIVYLKENPLSLEACRKRAELLFDKDKCFQQYVDLYEELMKGE